MIIFCDRKLEGRYSSNENGNSTIQVFINHSNINVSLSYSTFFNFLKREDAIRLELKSHPKLLVTETFDSQELCYLSLVTVNIMNIEQQILVRVYCRSSENNSNCVGLDFKKVFGLEIHKQKFTIKETPFLYKKDYLLFELLLKNNNLTRSDLIPIKDLDEL
ncbi:hypothetical protein DICPUDRAFT_152381 [Dictyostelium purpureum]|uniref:Uncharacterized protein n=1 Tax=Dictyostelium purpureum TaxID=5786 RepID=F0ZL73_DICPU|nr:uncharacterized protein DICPUDRAFT_152381 [Dictyostelium purpureum]EGC35299.1 hypothetical protein DICPUDRAFT_152381 [Dictyostelium purpureum]|eukprot:XP_003288166.1 hypothetical protein DICPUDRAFT_152381 [Dictyostelium purpureum]